MTKEISLREARKMVQNDRDRADLDNWFTVTVDNSDMWRIGDNKVMVKHRDSCRPLQTPYMG